MSSKRSKTGVVPMLQESRAQLISIAPLALYVLNLMLASLCHVPRIPFVALLLVCWMVAIGVGYLRFKGTMISELRSWGSASMVMVPFWIMFSLDNGPYKHYILPFQIAYLGLMIVGAVIMVIRTWNSAPTVANAAFEKVYNDWARPDPE